MRAECGWRLCMHESRDDIGLPVLCKIMGNPEKPKLSVRPSNFQNLNFQSAFSRFINMLKYSPQCVESKYLIRILIRALVVEIFKYKLCSFVLFQRSKCSKLD